MHCLTSWWGVFLRCRHNLRRFRRGALVRLQSHEDGLSEADVAECLRRVGPAEADHAKPLPRWRHLWQCYRNPLNVLLTLLAVASYLSEGPWCCCPRSSASCRKGARSAERWVRAARPLLTALLLGYAVLETLTKRAYIRRFCWQ